MAGLMLMALTLLWGLGTVCCIRCYQCSSLLVPSCGIEWDFDEGEGQEYLLECPAISTACDKIVSDWQGSGEQHVYRTCWNQTTENALPISGCTEEDVRGGAYCHCATDGCNVGHRQAASSVVTFIISFTLSLASLVFKT